MWQTACLVVNSIRVDSYALLFTLVVYATDRSKAVVLVLFLLCVALWF